MSAATVPPADALGVRPDLEQYGLVLRNALAGAGVNHYELAEFLGCSRARVYRVLHGRGRLTVVDIIAVSKLTGADPGDLVDEAQAIAERDAGVLPARERRRTDGQEH